MPDRPSTRNPSPELHRAISALQRLADAFLERREQLASDAGLTAYQWRLLEEISTEQFMPSLFARERSRSPAAVSKTLRLLLDRELVSVSVRAADGRQREYKLTRAGRRILARLAASRSRAIDSVWRDLDRRDLIRFAAFGEELGRRLDRYAHEQSGD